MTTLTRYYWWWKSRLPERRGQPCLITARGKMNTIRVEFLDGFIVFTSRYAVRREMLSSKSSSRSTR